MSAGVQNVLFEDVYMNGTSAGPHVKSCRGRGGVVQDIVYRNITLDNADNAVYLTLNYKSGLAPTNATGTPQFHNITLQNIYATNSHTATIFDGLPESEMTGISLINATFIKSNTFQGTCDYTYGVCDMVNPSCPTCFQ
jgi:polygalacturonase